MTRSPVRTDPTSRPTAATVPTNSAPRTHGSPNLHRDVPFRESRSEWLTPQASTRTSTSRGPIAGSATSAYRSTSAGPYSEKAAAFTARIQDPLGMLV